MGSLLSSAAVFVPCDHKLRRAHFENRWGEGLGNEVASRHRFIWTLRVQGFQTFETTRPQCQVVLLFSSFWKPDEARPKHEFLKLLLQQRKLVKIIIWISFLNSNITFETWIVILSSNCCFVTILNIHHCHVVTLLFSVLSELAINWVTINCWRVACF